MSDYLRLIPQNRMPQGYAYALRVGFSPGTMGSEYVSVVIPPVRLPGRSRLHPWYSFPRDQWIRTTIQSSRLEAICKRGAQYWLDCVFRWLHFLQQQVKMNELQVAANQDFRRMLQKTILQVFAFRLEYVVFYCHLRRVWQERRLDQLILPDPYGLCPRVCSDRSGRIEEDDGVIEVNRGLARPENRLEQCVSSTSLPTILTSSCFPDPHVGLHTTISFSCQCPANTDYKWMCGPKLCSLHRNWRTPGYWQEGDAKQKLRSTMWRFDPPAYYKHLQCSREGTLDVAYVCINDKIQLTYGFVRPQCRQAEYCVCKPRYHGALCDKVTNGNRYRRRTRKCLDPYHGDCQFPEERDDVTRSDTKVTELRLCRPRPCDRYLKLISQSIEKAPIKAMQVIWQSTKAIRVIMIVTCLLLLLVMALAFWTVSLQSRRAGLFAKECHIGPKEGDGKNGNVIEEKHISNFNHSLCGLAVSKSP
ncbi:unnamed protein product [Hydatigera taeniaeformis]|uniref:EGF-like domain-containing protein n=1 Tax=Hydatigena taeniaeformis TaxID=6205 RepID=A0A0R3X1E0_HYDTA|nr:unnamed protein product [Hydatigera taeniaeformis]